MPTADAEIQGQALLIQGDKGVIVSGQGAGLGVGPDPLPADVHPRIQENHGLAPKQRPGARVLDGAAAQGDDASAQVNQLGDEFCFAAAERYRVNDNLFLDRTIVRFP